MARSDTPTRESNRVWAGRSLAAEAHLRVGRDSAISMVVTDSPQPPSARLDPQLVAELPSLPEFKSVLTSIHELVDFFSAAAADPFSVGAPSEFHARNIGGPPVAMSKLLLFNRLLYVRTAELMPAAIRALNESSLVMFAQATRGVLETAAVATYHAKQLEIEDGATALPTGYDDRIRAAVLSSRFNWRRLLVEDPNARLALIDAYNVDPDGQVPPDAAKNIVTMVEKLARRIGEVVPKGRGVVRFDYALLSDMCHPSVGSNLIYVAETTPRIRAERVPQGVTTTGVATFLLPCLEYSAQELRSVLAELERLAERLATMPATTASPEDAGT